VRPHGEFVDHHAPGLAVVRGDLEHLDGEHAGHVEALGDGDGDGLRGRGERGVQIRCGGGHLGADAAALDRLDHGPGPDLPAGAPRHERGQFAPEGHERLGQGFDAVVVVEPVGRLGRGVDDAHALAVVAPLGALHHERPPHPLAEGGQFRLSGHLGPVRARHAERGQVPPHRDLVLGVHQRVGAGVHGHALALQSAQEGVRHVLVLEGQDLGAGRQRSDGPVVPRDADRRVRDHLGGGGIRRLDESPQPDAEPDGGLLHHPGELPPAHHGHHRSLRHNA